MRSGPPPGRSDPTRRRTPHSSLGGLGEERPWTAESSGSRGSGLSSGGSASASGGRSLARAPKQKSAFTLWLSIKLFGVWSWLSDYLNGNVAALTRRLQFFSGLNVLVSPWLLRLAASGAAAARADAPAPPGLRRDRTGQPVPARHDRRDA